MEQGLQYNVQPALTAHWEDPHGKRGRSRVEHRDGGYTSLFLWMMLKKASVFMSGSIHQS